MMENWFSAQTNPPECSGEYLCWNGEKILSLWYHTGWKEWGEADGATYFAPVKGVLYWKKQNALNIKEKQMRFLKYQIMMAVLKLRVWWTKLSIKFWEYVKKV